MNGGVLYCKLNVDFRSRASIIAKINEIDTLINTLLTTAATAISTGQYAEYDLDTGQTRTRIKYTSMQQITKAVEDYENLRTMYQVKLQGRHVRLVDEKNFR